MEVSEKFVVVRSMSEKIPVLLLNSYMEMFINVNIDKIKTIESKVYIQILKNCIFKGHYLNPQSSQTYQKQFFTVSSIYL